MAPDSEPKVDAPTHDADGEHVAKAKGSTYDADLLIARSVRYTGV